MDELEFLTDEDAGHDAKSSKASGVMKFRSSLTVSAKDAQQASGKGKYRTHGSDEQWTFRLPDGARAEIVEWAERFNLKQVDMKKWIVERGLVALRSGERPEMEVVEVRRIKR